MSLPAHPPGTGYPIEFVDDLLARMRTHGGRVQGIVGLQGTGKSTLAGQLRLRAAGQGLVLIPLSIDDFYLGHDARVRLGKTVHPLCATRGPPGTHDITLACEVIDALRDGRPVALPRFDKIDDDRLPIDQWPRVAQADLVVLEGWFLGVPPERQAALLEPLNALERDEDPGGTWRHWCNAALADDAPALWSRLDHLLFLQAPGFEVVSGWRWQQEQTLQAEHPGRRTMDQAQVERFVQFFERVSRQALRTLPAIADRTLALDDARRVRDDMP